jgi:hypothetical protein
MPKKTPKKKPVGRQAPEFYSCSTGSRRHRRRQSVEPSFDDILATLYALIETPFAVRQLKTQT